ncbi:uncharacterized protein LOC131157997 [Malania oleifera]|uniref:uncharacterized protein LOC131157997 n=1 Tax=Malania oleifera TaxID=397392 RepID=UPI0025ADB8A0|nr:uncharacterized protein LOC131157997 [Malania oleifera]
MDSRDSSSLTAASRDGSPADEEGVLSVAAALAKDAGLLFQSRKFAECVDVLNQLLQKKEDDPKVLHNIAIAEYFRDGCSDPKKLLEVLNNVKKRSEELARASGEQVEAVNNHGNKSISGSKGTNAVTQQFSAANSPSIDYTDEYDTSVATLNTAIIWFHLHEYAKALSILEPLYQNIEPIDETTALHICLLLLDVALASHDASKSADVINYLEKAFGVVSQADSGSAVQQQSSNLVTKSSSVPSNAMVPDASNTDSAANVNSSENDLSRTLSEETLEYDTLLSTLDMSGQNLTRAAGLPSSNDLSRTSADRSIPTVDLKLKLQLYKVRLLLLSRNLKAAKREAKIAMNIARGGDSSMALLLKSQLEYARGNYRKAIKLLMASSNRTETGILSIFNNNLGCIHYQLGKHHTSSIFFSRALSNSSSLRKDKPLKLLAFSQDKSLLIIYNCGIQYLACGKPILAARCFQKASMIFFNRPLLWLRVAECCLMAHEMGLLNSSGVDKSDVRVHVIGQGKWRQLVVEDGNSRNGHVDFSVERDDWFMGTGPPQLSMLLARQCLLNALQLLSCSESKNLKSSLPHNSRSEENGSSAPTSSKNSNHKNSSGIDTKLSNVTVGSVQVNSNGDAKDQKGVSGLNTTLQNSISDYEDICRRENHMIKQALLANLAYVELELDNPLKALSTAKSLLSHPECSRIYIFLGNVYAAEALCLLNRPNEAAEHLFIYLSGGNIVEFPYSEQDCEQLRTEKIMDSEELSSGVGTTKNLAGEESQGIVFLKPEEARGALYVDLAVMCAMQGDMEQAWRFAMQALSIIPNSTEAILTAVYADLVVGKTQAALAKLKQCSHVKFLPGNLTLNSSSSSSSSS